MLETIPTQMTAYSEHLDGAGDRFGRRVGYLGLRPVLMASTAFCGGVAIRHSSR
jgi:hypothetical protein